MKDLLHIEIHKQLPIQCFKNIYNNFLGQNWETFLLHALACLFTITNVKESFGSGLRIGLQAAIVFCSD